MNKITVHHTWDKDVLADYFTWGMIHSFTILAEIKAKGENLNDADFEELIEVQRRNLSDPGMKCPVTKIDEEMEAIK